MLSLKRSSARSCVWSALLAFAVLVVLWAPAAPAATNDIFTVAGTGTAGFNCDFCPATTAQLNNPIGVAATPQGGVAIADTLNHRVRFVGGSGTPGLILPLAGDGSPGFSGDGGSATQAQVNRPGGVATTANGGFLIADTLNNRVRLVDPQGTIFTVAGSGAQGFSGDGGQATDAELFSPSGVAATADGGFLIADVGNNRVRRVDAGGTITTVAGTGTAGFSGDGGRATGAELNFPFGVAATADGGFLIADFNNSRVRLVSRAGKITTVAGTGTAGFSGDGGPATGAQLHNPSGVAATANRGFLIADTNNERVRLVSRAGRITTVAGTGTAGFSGDGGLATAAQLFAPQGVAVTADGGFLIADTLNNRVRFVDAGALGAPPTSKADCRDGRWRNHGFASQGDCVAFVATTGKNEPGKNVPTPSET